MLLTHTSGIKDNYAVMPLYTGDSPNPLGTWLEDYLTPSGQYYDPDKNFYPSEPGTSWDYCNVAVALVGYLVEVISDVPFDEYCGINIFEPLDMDETAWFLADLDINHIAVPYRWNGYEYVPYSHMGWDCYPAGFLRTSVSQLNNFLLMYMNYGEYNSTIILDNDTVELMLTQQVPFEPEFYFLSEPEHGIIWLKCSLDGRTLWGHLGGLPGCSTVMWFDPEKNIGVIFLINSEESHSNLFKITEALFDFAETPYAPDIDGPPNGKPGVEYEYTFNAVDPDDDDVKYHIDWDDGNTEWTGFNASGTDVKLKHTWSDKGTYTIKAKAKDTVGFIGPEATFTVSITKTRAITSPFLNFLNSYPNLFPILRLLLQRLGL